MSFYFYPNAPGDETNITYQVPNSGEHWDKVDDGPTHDGNTTYVYSWTTVYQRDLYQTNASSHSVPIESITIKAIMNRQTMTPSYAKLNIKTHGEIYESSDKAIASGWNEYTNTWITNPYTVNPWTWSEICDLQIGISLWWTRCTAIELQVIYTARNPQAFIM